MKKKLTIILLVIIACFQFAWRTDAKKNIVAEPVRKYILYELKLLKENVKGISNAKEIILKRWNYTAARKHYKHVEFFIEYYSPLDAKLYINGPLVPKHDIDLGKNIIAPQGFQRIEEILYTGYDHELPNELAMLTVQINNLENYYKDVEITDGELLEMCQLQLYRIAALNLNGYDAGISKTNITETLWALEGIETTIKLFEPYTKQNLEAKNNFNEVRKQIANGKLLLQKNRSYDTFNRLEFITQFISPVNSLIVSFHNHLSLPWNQNKKALQLQNGFLFGKESFNLQFFSIYYDDTLHIREQAAIGKLLFSDPILSGNQEFSCTSCHNPATAFADGKIKSTGINGEASRNTPTLYNAIYQKAFFYDGKAYQLEQQALDVIHSAVEMNSSLANVVNRLQKNEQYKILFKNAFVNTADSSITEYAVQKVLTEYEKTLLSFNSPFDQYLNGNSTALSKKEINGYNIFAGKALCGSCHFFPLFNGTVPPNFTDTEFEVIGVPGNTSNNEIDKDEGRFAVTGVEEHRHAFKTPSVRNIALTAPYMHNGIYNSLEEVVEFYHRGGGKGLGIAIPNQTLPFDSLQLSKNEKEDIVLFLRSLTDTSFN